MKPIYIKVESGHEVHEHLLILRALLRARGLYITQQRIASLAIRAYSAEAAERDLAAAPDAKGAA